MRSRLLFFAFFVLFFATAAVPAVNRCCGDPPPCPIVICPTFN